MNGTDVMTLLVDALTAEDREPGDVARDDQGAAILVPLFALFGVDLRDPAQARAALAAVLHVEQMLTMVAPADAARLFAALTGQLARFAKDGGAP